MIQVANRRFWFLGLFVGAMVGLTLVLAPSNSLSRGSSFSRAPDGYAGWYAFMQQRGTPVQRWQKPLSQFTANQPANPSPQTLLQVYSGPLSPSLEAPQLRDWVGRGNRLVILAGQSSVTNAAFSSVQTSPVGSVKIETRRRESRLSNTAQTLLGDRFGAIVWQEPIGKGQMILATTPYLAANAYQDQPGNYAFLAQLVTQDNQPVWVDEYLHGYKDAEALAREASQDLLSYLAQKTPLLPVGLQAGVLLLLLIWAQNRRFGPPQTLSLPSVDSSEAYIRALAEVLRKAGSSEFVVDLLGQDLQRQVQRALGLGLTPLAAEAVIAAWAQQTGRPAAELAQILQPSQGRLSEADLLAWLEQVRHLRRHLPS